MKSTYEILSLYDIKEIKIEALTGGLINKTWKVETAEKTYTLQWVNPVFSHDIMEDLAVVIAHLKDKGFLTIEIIKTKEGSLYVPDDKGFWRVFSYIPGVVHQTTYSSKIVREAGALLGRFHNALRDLKHEFHYSRPLHRKSEEIYQKYSSILKKHPEIFDTQFGKELSFIDDLPSLLLPTTLPRRITHGDMKMTNIIFNEDNHAIALIDLDDCGNQHNTLIDIGDALSFWCQKADFMFSLELYSAALEGYFEGSDNLLTIEEKKLIPQALKLITLELASRFAIDIAEDYYFAWDESSYSSRREHNRVRVIELIKFYQDICKHENELSSGVKSYTIST